MSETAHPRDLSGDLSAGHYAATGTVVTGRRNLFDLSKVGGHHIGTLVSGSKTQHQRFDEDCDKIIRGLALLEAGVLEALERAEGYLAFEKGKQGREIYKAVRAALSRAEGRTDA